MYRVTAVQGILIILILLRILLLLRAGGVCSRQDIDVLKSRISDLERAADSLRTASNAEKEDLLSVITGCSDRAGIEEINTLLEKLLEKSDSVLRSLSAESGNTAAGSRRDRSETEYEGGRIFDAGLELYRNEEFGNAAYAFKKALYIDPENEEAAVFYYSALFNENPGDEGLYGKIKKELVPLAESGIVSPAARSALLKTLAGVFLEEGDRETAERYRNFLSGSGVPR